MEYSKTFISEGMAQIIIYKVVSSEGETLERARSRAPVFYNPIMNMNRDSAILALGALQRRLSRPLTICEPMCGTGIRGIRMALEVPKVREIVLGDMSPHAVRLTEKNIGLNGMSERVRVRRMEANLLLSLHARPLARFDYTDIDPFGTPAPFIDTVARATKRDGMVALTATDMAPLCGVNVRACIRKYGSTSLRTGYSHESALRILIGSFIRGAAIHEVASKPVFSFFADHYIRLYMLLDRGKMRVDKSLREIGYLLNCSACKSIRSEKSGLDDRMRICEVCGSEMKAAGPLWLGNLADDDFCLDMIECSKDSFIGSNRRLINIIRKVRGEIDMPPGFFVLDELSSNLGVASRRLNPVIDGLRNAGFKAAVSHANNRGLKTDASVEAVKRIVLELNVKGV
ncbi:tRNA (guanine(10)-N(2))-dimethyltransferase [Candidatus Bathyarchaeota archaeon]|jgi:tRNA (guanine26-N2/guanine27-N2)-dimethyltransferase|nr:tRNA (guanine(10)-N(2))-dimethyltransferase [Candidatus Bathyarchaeota archaeon]MDP7443451.1 tRNA (guanine(10)-N(2))-dimethyltransferase [Candidatus Bathyarchaeota archaeon]|tara:strand:- start:1378 stop:2580 length:1203 start_codon:yes stop_codon:yes gene_type:complete